MDAEVSPIKDEKIFVSDCEGPISKNDNAFELTSHLVPEGNEFFALLSRYDDVLADIIMKPGYKAGDTLKLIPPFLKAYGANNETIKAYSSNNILLVPDACSTLEFVRNSMPSFIVSTSYEQYISSLCDLTGFPFENVYCTRLDLDRYKMNHKDVERLKEIREEIITLPIIQIPEKARSIQDFSQNDQNTIHRLDEIFWNEISRMESGRMLREINPIGGYEKVMAVQDIIEKLRDHLSNVMYVGDSITDLPSLQLVKNHRGLAISFNGNEYALREAEIAVLSRSTLVTTILAEAFNNFGRDQVTKLVAEWSPSGLKKYCATSPHRNVLMALSLEAFPQVEMITDENRDRLNRESSAFRKKVRGEAIGRLG